MSRLIKPISIYLPQFHPIPENNLWWGTGFTEWTNVVKARPLFHGHHQPHLPADLGFYDLRLKETRVAQEELAKNYGIYGFCYYHYWFNGHRLLEMPVNEKLKNREENLPFMLCWANENWTRNWNGGNREVLIRQEYSVTDHKSHIKCLLNYFEDDRYIKVEGKPVFIIYRPSLIPNLCETIDLWRNEVIKAGFNDLYIGYAQNTDLRSFQKKELFDFSIDFQPNFSNRPREMGGYLNSYLNLISSKLKLGIRNPFKNVYDYSEFVKLQVELDFEKNQYPVIVPGWDNSPRRKDNYFILHNSSPELYKKWLKFIVQNFPWNEMPDNFLFINAWNEWAEGNHLEPCNKWGNSYLEATREVIQSIS